MAQEQITEYLKTLTSDNLDKVLAFLEHLREEEEDQLSVTVEDQFENDDDDSILVEHLENVEREMSTQADLEKASETDTDSWSDGVTDLELLAGLLEAERVNEEDDDDVIIVNVENVPAEQSQDFESDFGEEVSWYGNWDNEIFTVSYDTQDDSDHNTDAEELINCDTSEDMSCDVGNLMISTSEEESEGEDTDSTQDVEQLGGEVEPYELEIFERQRVRRFRLNVNNYRLRFNPEWLNVQRPENLPVALRRMFDRILEDLRHQVDGQDNDRVGLAIRHPALDAPMRIGFRRHIELRGEDIMNLIEKFHQSNVDLAVDDTMTIEFLHVEDPNRVGEGRGHRSKKAPISIECFKEMKRSILKIRNNDDLCFARALVTAIHYCSKPEPLDRKHPDYVAWRKKLRSLTEIRKNGDRQRDEAINLMQNAGIVVGPCLGRETWEALGRHLAPTYQLKIYSADIFNKLMYKTPVVDAENILHLFHNDNHYDVITTMTGFTGYNGYCEVCDIGYSTVNNHKCTRDFHCYQCKRPGFCGVKIDMGVSCLTCNRWFVNVRCYQRHLTRAIDGASTCDVFHRCKQCLEEFKTSIAHVCSENRDCKICKQPLSLDHRCYIQPIQDEEMTQQLLQGMPGASRDCRKRDIPQERAKRRFIFYDFETAQDTGKHVPNLCVTHLGCGGCIGNKSDNLCDTCPWRAEGEGPSRVKVFKGVSSLNDMGDWLLRVADGGTKKKGKKRKRQSHGDSEDSTDEGDDDDEEEAIIAIAHNYRGYDGHLLLQYLHKKIVKPPEILMRGQQILQMKVGRVTFKDSLNFLSMPLKNFPKTFGLSELQKGYFPHFFNTAANEDYVGPYPPVESYGADSMSITDREAFMKWYDGKIAQNAVFDMGEEILAYCLSDVDILRRGCAAFRQLFIDQNRVDPFKDAITLPMACMLVYRQNYLPENTIAIIPPLGYRPHVRYSIQSLQWLAWLMNVDATLDIQHSRNGGEMRFHCSNGKTYSVDGFDKKTKTVYEYLGCFWHGCARCYKTSRSKPHPTLGISMAETLHQTHFRLALLKNHPEVNAVVTIWECGFQGQTKENPELGNFLKGFEYLPMPLNPRDAFFGGRTNATKLFHEAGEDEKIMYVDVCSLYPYINKYGRYPVGHPKIVDKPDVSRLFDLHGLVMCRILPPKRLYHPLLPYRTCGKLMFPLCRTCADSQQQETCSHTDEERAWVGTYATVEVQEAVRECDYEVLHIFEAWHFEEFAQYDKDSRQGGLFTDYVNNFFKLKQEASGPPEQCENLQEYVQTIFDKEGVRLNEANVVKNPGLRMLGKACLNNFWGKLAQQESVTKSEYLSDPMTFFHMLLDESLRVQSVLVINDNLLFVSYEPQNDYLTPHSASNVVIAAWVTAQARLKLYSYIKPLDRRVLYFDTDSVIYIHRAEEWNPPLGDSLGELTDELDGNSIKTFVSAGPKNYSYLLAKPRKDGTQTTCKVRGFTLNYQASKKLNMETMKELIINNGEDTITIDYPSQIIRGGLRKNNEIVSKHVSKKYRRVYTKRRLLSNTEGIQAETLPYGWVE